MAFIVRKEAGGSIISCTPISGRLISIRISAIPHNITVIQVCAPPSDHEDEKVKQFYEQLDSIIAKTPKKDILVVQGGWNAKVGLDAHQHWTVTVGRFDIGNTNDRGWRPLEFAESPRLTLANTLHPHKVSRTTTWHAANFLICTGGRTVTSLGCADDIDGLAKDEELAKLVERLDKVSTAHGMEIRSQKTL